MENLISIIMDEMHICFRQQLWPKISLKVSQKVSTHDSWVGEGLSKVLREERKAWSTLLHTCSCLGFSSIFPGAAKLSI